MGDANQTCSLKCQVITDDPTGFAMTEAEAVMDLYAQIAEREALEEAAP